MMKLVKGLFYMRKQTFGNLKANGARRPIQISRELSSESWVANKILCELKDDGLVRLIPVSSENNDNGNCYFKITEKKYFEK